MLYRATHCMLRKVQSQLHSCMYRLLSEQLPITNIDMHKDATRQHHDQRHAEAVQLVFGDLRMSTLFAVGRTAG